MLDPELAARYCRMLKGLERSINKLYKQREHAHLVGVDVAAEDVKEACRYAAGQLASIRQALAEGDPLIGTLFPEIPQDASLSHLQLIAGQMADFVKPATEEAEEGDDEPDAPPEGAKRRHRSLSIDLSGLQNIGAHVRDAVSSALSGIKEIGKHGDKPSTEAGEGEEVSVTVEATVGADEDDPMVDPFDDDDEAEGKACCEVNVEELDLGADLEAVEARMKELTAKGAELSRDEAREVSRLARQRARIKRRQERQ